MVLSPLWSGYYLPYLFWASVLDALRLILVMQMPEMTEISFISISYFSWMLSDSSQCLIMCCCLCRESLVLAPSSTQWYHHIVPDKGSTEYVHVSCSGSLNVSSLACFIYFPCGRKTSLSLLWLLGFPNTNLLLAYLKKDWTCVLTTTFISSLIQNFIRDKVDYSIPPSYLL